MTGPLGLSAAPVSPSQAATKGYVDSGIATSLPLSGGILTGPLTLAADPTSALQATTKEYADTKLARAGDTLTGLLTLSGTPVNPYHAAPKTYVDTQILTVVPRAGGTMTGPLILNGAPTSTSQAATKSYVDTGLAAALPITGGTVTGPITLTVAPAIPTNVTNKQYVDTQISGVLPLSGGSLSGLLTLASAPSAPLHAATKQYVDANPGADGVINIKLAPCNATLNGVTDDTAAFIAAYQLAHAGGTIYVPNGTTVIQASPNWGIPTTKLVKWIVDGTTLSNGSPLGDAIPTGQNSSGVILPAAVTGLGTTGSIFSQGNSQPTDFAVLHASYVVSHTGGAVQSVISNSRTDTIISQSPYNNVWSGYDRLVWNGSQTPSATSPSKHVGRYVQAIRQTVGTNSAGAPLPQPLMWSAYVQYLDTTGNPSSWTNASVTTEMDWIGNGVDDANQRLILSLVLGQNNTAGAAAELSTAVGVSIASGSTGKVYRVFNVNVPIFNINSRYNRCHSALWCSSGSSGCRPRYCFRGNQLGKPRLFQYFERNYREIRRHDLRDRQRHRGFVRNCVQCKRHIISQFIRLYCISRRNECVQHNSATGGNSHGRHRLHVLGHWNGFGIDRRSRDGYNRPGPHHAAAI